MAKAMVLFLAALVWYTSFMATEGTTSDHNEFDRDSLVTMLERERERAEHFKALYEEMLLKARKLEKGLLTTHSEKLDKDQLQLTLGVLEAAFAATDSPTADTVETPSEIEDEAPITVKGHQRQRRGRRSKLPENLERKRFVEVPDEVMEIGLEHFDVIGEERSETLERQVSGLYIVEVIRPKFVPKDRNRDRSAAAQRERDLANVSYTDVLVADPVVHPIPKSIAGPQLLADTVVQRWEDHMPLFRLQKMLSREGVPIARSTICGWHSKLAELVTPLIDAMWADARGQPILYTDATGVRVQAKKRCRRAHFWVVISPHRHLLYAFTKNHKKSSVRGLLGGFRGKLVADAHTVYDHLYIDHGVIEVGCWAHARRYLHKALDSQPELALEGLLQVNKLFRLERAWQTHDPSKRTALRKRQARPIVDGYFQWCEHQQSTVFEGTPLYKAVNYAINQKIALQRFLGDGKLPIHNNASERALRRHAIGRKNWLFVGNDEGGHTNAKLVTLLASCALHQIEPRRYLRDLFCLLPQYPHDRLLDLAPVNWTSTVQRADVEAMLMGNVFWRAAENFGQTAS